MGYPKRLLPALLAGLWLGAPLAAAAQTTAQASLLAQALDAAATGDWTEAATLAAWTGSPIAKDIVLWTRLRDGAGTWDEYEAFLARNPDWPGLATLRRAGERQMPKGLPPEEVIAFFAEPPQTGTGSLRLAEALDGERAARRRRRPRSSAPGREFSHDPARAHRHARGLARGAEAAPSRRGSTCCSGGG